MKDNIYKNSKIDSTYFSKKQQTGWEHEYQHSKLLTKKNQPQSVVLRFLKWLKKDQNVFIENLSVLDLGCGTGRNTKYLAERDNYVIGYDFSKTAIDIAVNEGNKIIEKKFHPHFEVRNIGESYPIETGSIDLVLDVTSSNSLSEKERATYLTEVDRVLKPGGYFFVRALSKDADKNAKFLINNNPGPEKDTYVLPELRIIERAFSQKDFETLYGKYFLIHKLEKATGYARMNNRNYKRHYWIAYMQKK